MFGMKISPLHPPVVHFVVAFAVASVLFECAGLLFKNQALRRTAFHLLILTGIAIRLAIWAGLEDAEGISLTDKTGLMIVRHRNLAYFTAGTYALFLLLQVIERWKYRMRGVPTGLRILSLLAALAGLLLGGSMAWAQFPGIGLMGGAIGTTGGGAQGPGISGMPCPGISICPGIGMMGAMFGGGLFRGGAAGPVGPGAAAPFGGGVSRGGG